nr:MAG TPA: prohead serine protease [Caudoviricetes sp.]
MKLKDVNVQVKALQPEDGTGGDINDAQPEGVIEAYASIFGNKDSYGDVVMPGAFVDTIAEWAASDNVLPLLYGHDFHDPYSNIGAVTSAEEDSKGLKIVAQFDMDNPKAKQVFNLVARKRITQMSFAYEVVEGESVTTEDDWHYEIRKVKLYEISVVPIGANQETAITAVKSGVRDVQSHTMETNHPDTGHEPPAGSGEDETATKQHQRQNYIKAGLLLLEQED